MPSGIADFTLMAKISLKPDEGGRLPFISTQALAPDSGRTLHRLYFHSY